MLDISLIGRDQLIYGMLGSLAAAGTLLVVATRFGLPVSTTHAIVGAIVGFGVVSIGPEVVNWGKDWADCVVVADITFAGRSNCFWHFSIHPSQGSRHKRSCGTNSKTGPRFLFPSVFYHRVSDIIQGLKALETRSQSDTSTDWINAIGFCWIWSGHIFYTASTAGSGRSKTSFQSC